LAQGSAFKIILDGLHGWLSITNKVKQEATMRTDDVLKFSSLFKVNVCHDTEENVWVAYCEDLGLSTEADSYEDLTERVWEIAPELYEMNGYKGNLKRLHLSFIQEQNFTDRMAL
jgi:hypothetical protein